MKRLAEILALVEFVPPKQQFKVYCEHPYGGGLQHEPLKLGEVIPTDDGEEAEFVSASEDGKLVVTKVNGQLKKFKPSEIGCKILPAGTDTSKDPDFIKEEALDEHLLGKADEYRLEIDRDGYVTLLDGEGSIRVRMPKDIWKELAEKTYKSLGGSVKAY